VKDGDWVLAGGGQDITGGERVRIKQETPPAVGNDSASRNEPPLRVD
jgi:hypothetical protein